MEFLVSAIIGLLVFSLVGISLIHVDMDLDIATGFAIIASIVTFFGIIIYYNTY